MSYQRKTVDEYEIQGYYSEGWEMLTTTETYKEARQAIKSYQMNDPGPLRIVKRRVRKESEVPTCSQS